MAHVLTVRERPNAITGYHGDSFMATPTAVKDYYFANAVLVTRDDELALD
jgi:hypothetical protein